MHENGMEDFTQEEAESLYAQIHTTGELTDEELENVTGGKVSVGGQKYKVVTSGMGCFTGKWEHGLVLTLKERLYFEPIRKDHKSLRKSWNAFSDEWKCGSCIHLGFKAGTGYCEVEHE